METSRGNSLVGLLGLVAAADGKIKGRLRLQKEAFLLSMRGDVPHFRPQSFTYHYYGPYSRELSDTLQFAVGSGLLSEEAEDHSSGEGVTYSYRLTDEGRQLVEDSNPLSAAAKSVVPRLQKFAPQSLELASTIVYLTIHNIASDEKQAHKKALELKPHCQRYEEEAEKVLQSYAE